MSVVVFDPEEFRDLHPKFADWTDVRLQGAFDAACLYLDNSDSSVVPYDPDGGVETRKILLYMATCHLVSLASLPAGVAGPMTSASEGSVSAGYGSLSPTSGKWWAQTPCGQAFWQAILPWLIGGRYFPDKRPHPWG